MNGLTDLPAWRDAFLESVLGAAASIAGFLPQLFAALAILLVGWLVARALEVVAGFVLRNLALDRASARVGLRSLLERAGLESPPSQLSGRLVFWLVMLSFVLATADTLGFEALRETLDRLAAYVPTLIGAALTAGLGTLLARFAGALTRSTANAAGVPGAPRLGFAVQALAIGLVVVLVIEQLGVETSLLTGPLTALLATAGLAVGLAFALGAHPIVTHILAGHFLKQSLPRDGFVEVAGERGVVERVGPTDTLLRDGDRCWSVPNRRLLEEVVGR